MSKARKLEALPLRESKDGHFCGVCLQHIEPGERYRDGGYGRRFHELCAHEADTMSWVNPVSRKQFDEHVQNYYAEQAKRVVRKAAAP